MRVLSLVLIVLGTPALAQSTEVKKYLNTAITLFENLEYEKALKQLKSAKAKAAGPDDEAKIALLEACVLADMGREEKALAAFKTAFSVDLDAKLPVEVGPKGQAVAEKARASVRKLLAPQFEAQKAEEQRRLAAEKQRAEERQRAEAEARLAEQRRLEAERLKNAGAPPMVAAEGTGPSARALSWIPGVVGLAAGGAATGLLLSANGKYVALRDKTVAVEQAAAYRDSGRAEATLGYVFTAVGAVGVVTAAIMFAAGGDSGAPVVSAVPLSGGGYVAASWSL